MFTGRMFRELHSRTAWIVVALLTGVASAVAILALIFPGGRRYNIWHVRWWARVLMKVARVKVAVKNFDLIPEEGACIFVSNHQSLLDIPAVVSVLPGRVRFMAKRSLFKIPIFGWCLTLEGFVPVDRANRERARRSLEPAEKVLATGTRLFIFPEGTRSRTGETGTFKTGAFRLAISSGVPIVPLAILGAEDVLPPGHTRIRPGTITLIAGDRIDPSGLRMDQRHELMDRVREWVVRTRKAGTGEGSSQSED